MSVAYAELPSPVGRLRVVSRDGALIRLSMLGDPQPPPADWTRDELALAPALAQLRAYFAGELTRFTLPLAAEGSEFQRRGWFALTQIPHGETISYGELARRVDQPGASRAVGMANNRNPIAIVVPCHRVVGADGRLVGFGGGIPRKQWLLAHETRHAFKLTSPTLAPARPIAHRP